MVCEKLENEKGLLCDGCENARHTFCCKPKLAKVPEDDWYCGACAASPPEFKQSD